jgi:hypothetical protein
VIPPEGLRNLPFARPLPGLIDHYQRSVNRDHGVRGLMTSDEIDDPLHRVHIFRYGRQRDAIGVSRHERDPGVIAVDLPGHVDADE